MDFSVSAIANASSGDFAPYFISALTHGKISQKSSAFADVAFFRDFDYDSRFSWGFGAEVLAGSSSKSVYHRWDESQARWVDNPQRPASAWLQQLYAELKYRAVFVTVGLKEHEPALLNAELSSGDFIESGNARPIPEIRAGFIDFVDIPLTNGWLQIQGHLAYGKMTDSKSNENRFNRYSYHLATGSFYNYKFCFFRTNPQQRFMATFGMQSGAFFGGKSEYFHDGKYLSTNYYKSDLKSLFNMLIPVLNHEETFAQGSTIGSWDFYGQYMLNGGGEICAYFQWPFEDGSGIARRNKLDGIWGFEYTANTAAPIAGVVLEYIDFRDQSGPIHYAPADYEGTTLTEGISGRDDYYNNGFYNSYANYGLSIGTPFLVAPLYNLDGYPAYTANRANGVHLGINGYLSDSFKYRMLFGYQRSVGTYNVPYTQPRTDTSMLLEGKYTHGNLDFKAQLAFDRGTLRGNNFGALFSVSYNGIIGN